MSYALVSSIVSAAFAGVVVRRFFISRRPAFAAWGLGLAIFAAAAACQAVGEKWGFTPFTFRMFYLLGGVLGVAYLALGTVFLMAPRRVAWATAGVLAAITVATAVDAATVSVDTARLSTPAGILGEAIARGTLLHVAAVVLNIVGSLVLVAGSGWSAITFWRSRAGLDRVVCNVLLTVGAFVIAAGFSAAKVVGGSLDALGAYEAVGITVMFAGFLSLGRVGAIASRREAQRRPAAPVGEARA